MQSKTYSLIHAGNPIDLKETALVSETSKIFSYIHLPKI